MAMRFGKAEGAGNTKVKETGPAVEAFKKQASEPSGARASRNQAWWCTILASLKKRPNGSTLAAEVTST